MALTNVEKQQRFKAKQHRLGRKELRGQYLTPTEADLVFKLIRKLQKARPAEE